jgi:CheY-like chemotaxis protein
MLEARGYRVTAAANGPEAVRAFEERASDVLVLITDIVMPGGMSGVDLARALLQKKPSLKVLYMSGYAGDLAAGDQQLREGVNFLQKPFTPETLLACVRRCIELRDSVHP